MWEAGAILPYIATLSIFGAGPGQLVAYSGGAC